MTQMNGTLTFETRKMEEAITEAVLAKVVPGVAQVAQDVQRLTKLLEAEAVEPAEMAAVLAHSGAVSIEVATAQADSLTRLGYRLMPVPPPVAPTAVTALWAGPTPPQVPAVQSPDVVSPGPSKVSTTEPDPDKTWTAAFE